MTRFAINKKNLPSIDTVVPVLKGLNSIAGTISNYAPVPGLTAVLSVAQDLAVLVQTMKMNREDAEEVMMFMKSIIDIMERAAKVFASTSISLSTRTMLEEELWGFHTELSMAYKALEEQYIADQALNWLTRALHQPRYTQLISKCKLRVNQSVMKFQLTLNIDILRNLTQERNLEKIDSGGRLEILSSWDLKPTEVVDDRYPHVFKATYRGPRKEGKVKSLLVVKFPKKDEMDKVKDRLLENWSPNQPQLVGYSEETPFFLAMEDPGPTVQAYLQQKMLKATSTKDASLIILDIIVDITKAVIHQFSPGFVGDQGCTFEMAHVFIRGDTEKPVLGDFSPVGRHQESDSVKQALCSGTWNSFASFAALVLTGKTAKPDFLRIGLASSSGKCLLVSRSLLHMIFAFPWILSGSCRITGDMSHIVDFFERFLHTLEYVRETVVTAPDDTSIHGTLNENPIGRIVAAQYPVTFCGIWDVWRPLGAQSGDIGYMQPGPGFDVRRPTFVKLQNVADDVTGGLGIDIHEIHGASYKPEGIWCSEYISENLIRHTVRITRNCRRQTYSFKRSPRREKLSRPGWNMTGTWEYMHANQSVFKRLSEEHDVPLHDLHLVFSVTKELGYAVLVIDLGVYRDSQMQDSHLHSPQDETDAADEALQHMGISDGNLYFFENLAAPEGSVYGYWSSSPESIPDFWCNSCTSMSYETMWPLPPRARPPGPYWGWRYTNPYLEIEVSKKGPVEHVRYLTL